MVFAPTFGLSRRRRRTRPRLLRLARGSLRREGIAGASRFADGALRAHWQVPGVQALPAAKTGTCPQVIPLRKSSAV